VTITRRLPALAALVPAAVVGLLAVTTPAGAVLTEGDPGPAQCVRVVSLAEFTGSSVAEPGSPLFVAHGVVAVLVSQLQCSPAAGS
jgi:hypothetical protein